MEVYYERLLKLANSLQHKIQEWITTIFACNNNKYEEKTLQQYKEATLVCEEGFFEVKAIINILAPHNSKMVLTQRPQKVIKIIGMYYTNCHKTNHNVETCRIKRKENPIPIVFEVTIR